MNLLHVKQLCGQCSLLRNSNRLKQYHTHLIKQHGYVKIKGNILSQANKQISEIYFSDDYEHRQAKDLMVYVEDWPSYYMISSEYLILLAKYINLTSLPIVRALVESKCDVNITNSRNETALNWASWNGSRQFVNLLVLQPDINLNIPDNIGYTALVSASAKGCVDIVKKLLNAGATDTINNGKTALEAAIRHGFLRIVRKLISQKPENDRSEYYNTSNVLSIAVLYNRQSVVHSILEVSNIDTVFLYDQSFIRDCAKMSLTETHKNIMKKIKQYDIKRRIDMVILLDDLLEYVPSQLLKLIVLFII